MNTLKLLSKSLRFYSYRLNREHTANFISIKKIIPDYQNLETQCNCYLENLKLNDPIAPITNITTKVSDISPKSMIPVYKRHVLLIDETSSSKQAHMNWQSKLEDNDESVYPYGILKRIKEKNLQLMKQQNEECLPILMNVIELVNIAEDPVSAQDSTKTGKNTNCCVCQNGRFCHLMKTLLSRYLIWLTNPIFLSTLNIWITTKLNYPPFMKTICY